MLEDEIEKCFLVGFAPKCHPTCPAVMGLKLELLSGEVTQHYFVILLLLFSLANGSQC